MLTEKKNIGTPPTFLFRPQKKLPQKINIIIEKNLDPPQQKFVFDPLQKIVLQKKKKKNGIGAFIRIGWEIQCLPYAGFLDMIFMAEFECVLSAVPIVECKLVQILVQCEIIAGVFAKTRSWLCKVASKDCKAQDNQYSLTQV